MKDLFNNIAIVPVIAPETIEDDTALVGEIVDRLGFHSITYAIAAGEIVDVDAVFEASLEHGDEADLSDAEAVPAQDLLGTIAGAGFTLADIGGVKKLGYIGPRRYTRLTITPVDNEGAATLSVVAILGHPERVPT